MIKQVSHTVVDTDPAAFALALEVAYELHEPVPRAPELARLAQPALAHGTGRRAKAATRGRRRTVRG
ncbi:hypothetical protein AB0H86_34055 [Streptomyces sp. NPDC050997]|uniref:hypothetical protein n=1 Tax=Streptomyces sp. NPDC050997 TaxID=3155519 RepID=UPI00343DF00A